LEIPLFYILALTAAASAIVVVTNRKPAYSVLALALMMVSLSGFFILLKAYFVAMIQILIYAGAILVLFLFVIMLLGIGSSDASGQRKVSVFIKMRRAVNIALLIAFASQLVLMISAAQHAFPQKNFSGTVETIGTALFNQYLLPFELVSGILLIGIFGVVNLTQRELSKKA